MAVTLVGADSGDGGAGSALTATCVVPATAQAGDILIAYANAERGLIPTITGHSGSPDSVFWNVADGTQSAIYAYYKTVVAGDIGATLTATVSSGRRLAIGCQVFRGVLSVQVATTSTTVGTAQGAGVVNAAMPNITPTNNDAMLVSVDLPIRQSTPWVTSVTPGSGWTEDVDDTSTSASSSNAGVYGSHKILTGGGGASQTGETVVHADNYRYFGATLALNPLTTITVTLNDTMGIGDAGSTFISQFAGEDNVGLTDNITVITPTTVDVDGSPFSIIGTAQGTPVSTSYVVLLDAVGALFKKGSQVQLYQPGGTLREATVFTITDVSAPAFGFRNISVTPNFATIVAANDTLRQAGWSFTTDAFAALTKFADSAIAMTYASTATMARSQDIAAATLGLTLTRSATASLDRPLAGTMAVTWSGSAAAVLTSVGNSTLPITYGSTATATSTRAVAGALALTSTLTATAVRDRSIAGSVSLTASLTADATVIKGGNSALALTGTLAATVSLTRDVNATLATTYAGTATAVRDRPVAAVINMSMGFTASMTVDRSLAATLALTYTPTAATSRTAAVGGTLALSALLNADTAGNPSLQGALNTTVGLTATAAGSKFTSGSISTVFGVVADTQMSRFTNSNLALTLGLTATAAVTKFASATLALSAVLAASTQGAPDIAGVLPVAFTGSGTMLADRSGSATLPITAALTSMIVRQKNVDANSLAATLTLSATGLITGGAANGVNLGLTLGLTASASVTRSVAGALALSLPLTGVLNSTQRIMGNMAFTFTMSATLDQAPTFIGDDQGHDYLQIQRALTHSYIMDNPSDITLTPRFKTRTASGGYLKVIGAARATQTMRLIEAGVIGNTQNPGRTETGFVRLTQWQLMAEYGAAIQPDDVFVFDGRNWRVVSIMQHNGYEVRAVVERLGE